MSSNRKFSIILSLWVLITATQAAEPEHEAVARLIENIMPPHSAELAVGVIAHPEKFGLEEVTRAQIQIDKAKEATVKLRAMIKVGTNVFDYPGILSRGFITYQRTGGKGYYNLAISRVGGIRSKPYGFELSLDDHGIVTKIYDAKTEAH